MTLSDDLQEHPIRAGLDLGASRHRASRASPSRCGTSSASPVTQAYPEYKRAGLPALPRAPPAAPPSRTASRSASAARSARRPARPTASASSPAENEPDARVSPGERYARIYEINMARCIFCGYCEIACPFDAITLGNDFELSELSRDALVYTKEMLLEPPLRRTPAQDPERVRPRRAGDRGRRRARHVPRLLAEPRRGARRLMGIAVFYVAGAAARSARRSPSSCSATRSWPRSR